jgi:two-component system response regulator HydG
MRRLIERVADSASTVLIRGETGSGKELVARALHETSSRRAEPFVAVNGSALPGTLIECGRLPLRGG